MEISPFLNKELPEPLYIQLYHWIRKEIEDGRLMPGTKMPSIRELTANLNVSRNTVETAYQQLQAEGYLESIPKSGVWVAEIEKPVWHLPPVKHPIIPEKPASPEVAVDFEYGNVDLDKFPIKQWKKCLTDAIDQQNNWLFQYGDKIGEFSLRKEIAHYLQQSRGVRATPEQILITAGTQTSISVLCRLLSLNGETVAMEEPGYLGVRTVFKDEGCHLKPIPLEHDGLSVKHLQTSMAKAIYVTPSHQFPYGMVLPVAKRIQLLKWAYQTNGYIFEDDYDGEFRYRGQPIPSLKSLDEEGRVIYLGTLSKCFLPTARLSYMVLPPSLMELLLQKFAEYNQSVSPIIQRAVAQFMKSGEFEKHIRRMRKWYQRKHQVLLTSIQQYMDTRVSIIGEKSGLHILLKLNGVTASKLIECGLSHGVKVYSPARFWLLSNDEIESIIMLGFGGLSLEEIEQGIRILASCLPKDLEKKGSPPSR